MFFGITNPQAVLQWIRKDETANTGTASLPLPLSHPSSVPRASSLLSLSVVVLGTTAYGALENKYDILKIVFLHTVSTGPRGYENSPSAPQLLGPSYILSRVFLFTMCDAAASRLLLWPSSRKQQVPPVV